MAPTPFIYVVKTFKEHGIDYNKNGRLSAGDDVVLKMLYNKNTKKYDIQDGLPRLITQKARKGISAAMRADDGANPQRVVYHNNVGNPQAPIVFKDETSFGQHLQAGIGLGAGMEIGELAVDGIVNVLGSMFE